MKDNEIKIGDWVKVLSTSFLPIDKTIDMVGGVFMVDKVFNAVNQASLILNDNERYVFSLSDLQKVESLKKTPNCRLCKWNNPVIKPGLNPGECIEIEDNARSNFTPANLVPVTVEQICVAQGYKELKIAYNTPECKKLYTEALDE